ncbi:MAG: CpsD/CapB family tyrosine-protein kinase [Gammaproteobacteria bacterium]
MERMIQAVSLARQAQEGMDRIALASPRVSDSDKGNIDYERAQPVTLDDAVLRENRVLTGIEPDFFAESYRLLRTQILRRFRENNWNTLAITSPREGAGKTLTAINLAICMAREITCTVLLVDANLRQPRMMKHLGLSERKGLSDFLTEDMSVSDLLVQSDSYNDLVILPGGQPLDNSAEMLNSPKMWQLVRDMKAGSDHRIIIFDLPPMLPTADALAFSPQVDAALLVIEDGVTVKPDLERTVAMLDCTSIVGTVLNKKRPSIS